MSSNNRIEFVNHNCSHVESITSWYLLGSDVSPKKSAQPTKRRKMRLAIKKETNETRESKENRTMCETAIC